MKIFVAILLLFSFSKADELSSFLNSYKSGKVKIACAHGRNLYRSSNMRDEQILLAIADVCAKADFIDFIAQMQERFGKTSQSRAAAVYVSTLVLQKKLISQFLNEDVDISTYNLPKTDHILSNVFEDIKNKNYKLIQDKPKHIQIEDNGLFIEVFLDKKICIDVYKDKIKVQRHRYRI